MEINKNNEEQGESLAYCLEVKGVIEEMLCRMRVDYDEIEVFKGLSDSGPKFVVKSQESGILIGHHGENLRAFSHLVRRIIFQRKNGVTRFTLDINNYQEESAKKIRNKVIFVADEVKKSKKPVELEPMSAYERMIIHSLFSSDPEIQTESIGEKSERRVVIRPKT
ncbi:MAG: R3H domain-containing nucleic acid-binding protein [Candidatus Paceibacterota bacterium]|nr:MAG: R3H domain-containing nucleic acid-binding protein [Candidatus Paceibacterota bacterium]